MQYPGMGIWIEGEWWSRDKILTSDISSLPSYFFDREVILFLKNWFDDSAEFPGFTSGSTGTPKLIRLVKEYCWASALSTLSYFKIKPKTNALLSMPARFIAGRMMIVRAIAGELNLKMISPSSVPDIPGTLLSLAAFTPHQFGNLLNEPEKNKGGQIELILLGGAPVSADLIQKMEEVGIKSRVFETFGMTETYSHIAIKSLYPEKKSFFEAVPNVRFDQEDGQLIIHAPHIGREYLKTNDMVELISDQKFKWMGRADFVVNSGGIKLFPEKIENKLSGFIEEVFFSYGVPDKALGQRLILVVEEGGIQDEDEIWKIADTRLEKYEKPKEVFFVREIQYTSSGKIDRSQTLLKNHYFA
ncbi:AMP-binding protein [Membranihabitans maritimus]|uniref:AMP-binding protein n=1 Tax=Membranihabitans maritimus TaxID=2904244 RepID=UPI001F364F19|nr:AMP-binding protein [Membranihabitans maritimus]